MGIMHNFCQNIGCECANPGPQGPAGPPGPQGVPGPAGAPGPAGPAGAGVVASGDPNSHPSTTVSIPFNGVQSEAQSGVITPIMGAPSGSAGLTPVSVQVDFDPSASTVTGDDLHLHVEVLTARTHSLFADAYFVRVWERDGKPVSGTYVAQVYTAWAPVTLV